MTPSLANTVAHSSSNDTVPIKITTSRTRSSSATPINKTYSTKQTSHKEFSCVKDFKCDKAECHIKFTIYPSQQEKPERERLECSNMQW